MEKNNKNNIFYVQVSCPVFGYNYVFFCCRKMTFCFKWSEMSKETVLKKSWSYPQNIWKGFICKKKPMWCVIGWCTWERVWHQQCVLNTGIYMNTLSASAYFGCKDHFVYFRCGSIPTASVLLSVAVTSTYVIVWRLKIKHFVFHEWNVTFDTTSQDLQQLITHNDVNDWRFRLFFTFHWIKLKIPTSSPPKTYHTQNISQPACVRQNTVA